MFVTPWKLGFSNLKKIKLKKINRGIKRRLILHKLNIKLDNPMNPTRWREGANPNPEPRDPTQNCTIVVLSKHHSPSTLSTVAAIHNTYKSFFANQTWLPSHTLTPQSPLSLSRSTQTNRSTILRTFVNHQPHISRLGSARLGSLLPFFYKTLVIFSRGGLSQLPIEHTRTNTQKKPSSQILLLPPIPSLLRVSFPSLVYHRWILI